MTIIVDTGALVALIDPDTAEHEWVRAQTRYLPRPLLTSEPVLTEAAFLLARDGFDVDLLFALAESGLLAVAITFAAEQKAFRALMRRYRQLPMSLADASLVRLSELHDNSRILALDSDFRIYRRHGNKTIPVLMPD